MEAWLIQLIQVKTIKEDQLFMTLHQKQTNSFLSIGQALSPIVAIRSSLSSLIFWMYEYMLSSPPQACFLFILIASQSLRIESYLNCYLMAQSSWNLLTEGQYFMFFKKCRQIVSSESLEIFYFVNIKNMKKYGYLTQLHRPTQQEQRHSQKISDPRAVSNRRIVQSDKHLNVQLKNQRIQALEQEIDRLKRRIEKSVCEGQYNAQKTQKSTIKLLQDKILSNEPQLNQSNFDDILKQLSKDSICSGIIRSSIEDLIVKNSQEEKNLQQMKKQIETLSNQLIEKDNKISQLQQRLMDVSQSSRKEDQKQGKEKSQSLLLNMQIVVQQLKQAKIRNQNLQLRQKKVQQQKETLSQQSSQRLRELEEQMQERINQIKLSYKNQIENIWRQKQQLKKMLESKQSQIKLQKRNDTRQLEAQLKKCRQALSDQRTRLEEKVNESNRQIEKWKNALTQQLQQKNIEIEDLDQLLTARIELNRSLQQQVSELKKMINSLKNQKTGSNHDQVSLLKSKVKALQTQLQETKKKWKTEVTALNFKVDDMQLLQRRVKLKEKQLQTCKKQKQALKSKCQRMQNELKQFRRVDNS